VHTVQIPGNINIQGKITQNIGNQNTAIGLLSFASNTSGGYNTVFGYNSMTSNTGGAYCTAVGCNALQTSNAFGNTAIGYNAGIDVQTGTYNTFLGHNANTSQVVSNSTAIGSNASCTASNQIMLGTSSGTVVAPGNLSCDGLISGNRLTTSGDLTCNGLISANRLSATGNISFAETLNSISATTFSYLSGVTSSIRTQINTIENRTRDISWTSGQVNKTTINNQCETSTLSFSQTINSISATTFSYLSGVTSSIQNQINALANTNPPGTVIQFAGSSANLSGYLPCNGDIYNASNYNALFNAIGTIYGDGGSGTFRVPDYRAVFLRGAGQQNVRLNVIAGGGGPIVFKGYTAPDLGKTVIDQSTEFTTSSFVDNINTQVKPVVTGSSAYVGTFSYTNAISSLNFTTNNNGFNYGNQEVHPVHASVQYFIKY
jgi:microcystin-dependent protein